MAIFSVRSERALLMVHPRLQQVCREAIKRIEFAVVCGYRSRDSQFNLFKQGREERGGRWVIVDRSKVVTYLYGRTKMSKHNAWPARAVDLVPCGRNGKPTWDDTPAFERLAGIMLDEARVFGLPLTWGGSWKMRDLPHFEIS